MERRERVRLSKSRLFNIACTIQPGGRERSCLTRTESPYLLSRVRGKGKERIQLPAAPLFQKQGVLEFWRLLGDNDLGGGGIQQGKLAHYIQHLIQVQFQESIGLLQVYRLARGLKVFNNSDRLNRQFGGHNILFSLLLTNCFPTDFY